MPLASSLDSSNKASKQRLSLPSTIDSSTVATRSKAMKRRASMRLKKQRDPSPARSSDKENVPKSPGPTPYWKVAEERETSPRLTRSASKKKRTKERLPPFANAKNNNGGVLMFSPPDQEANRRRQQEEKERKDREIAQRVAAAKTNGDLQIFSPNGSHANWWPEGKRDADGQVCLQLSPRGGAAVDERKPAASDEKSNGDNEQVAIELKSIRETMNKLLESQPNMNQAEKKALEEQVIRNEQLSASCAKLETTNERLHCQMKGLETELACERESFAVEKTRLEGELGFSKRETHVQIQRLEESRKVVEDQLKLARQEKTAAAIRVAELENEINLAREKIQEKKHEIETLRSERQREKHTLTLEGEKLAGENEQLSSELESVKKVRDDMKRQLDEYEGALDSLENQLLPESEAQLKKKSEELCVQKEATREAEDKLKEKEALIEKMKVDLEALENEKEEERIQFQKLNEESSKAFGKMQNEASAMQESIQSLELQLNGVQEELEKEKGRSREFEQQRDAIQRDMDECMEELERSLQGAEQKLQQSEQERAALEEKLEAAMNQVAELLSAKKDTEAENSTKSKTLKEMEAALTEATDRIKSVEDTNKRLQDEARDRQLRMNDQEHRLKTVLGERDDARSRMDTFDVREEELYRKLRESDRIRRDLHNRVMQLSGNIRVYVRVRPALQGELEKVHESFGNPQASRKRKVDEILEEENPFHFPGVYDRASPSSENSSRSVDDLTKNIIEVTEPYKDRGGLNPRRKKWRFGFDHVFAPEQGQEDVWEATEPLVQSTIDGFNVCIFAYGQTGSGKTYTMLGEPSNEGIITRSVSKLFEAKHEMEALSRGATKVSLSVELLEIYNEQVRDLLAPNSGPSGRELSLKVTSSEVVGNIVVPTSTKEEVMEVLELAQKRRCVKATMSNAESSRSHMVFTIHFSVENKDGVSRTGKLHICDLAGSERLNKSGAHAVPGGTLLRETKHINSSLSVLSNVIERLQAGSPNVPYRESKLTFLLQNSLGGNSKTLAIVCCNPLSSHFHESLCSLRFAAKVNKVDLKAVANFSC